NVTLHAKNEPTPVHQADEDIQNRVAWIEDETNMKKYGVAEFGVAGDAILWPQLVQVRISSTGWSVLRCYNCGLDMYATAPGTGDATVVFNVAVAPEDIEAAKDSADYSPVFEVVLPMRASLAADTASSPATVEQARSVGEAEILRRLVERTNARVDAEEAAMRDRIAKYKAQQEAAFDTFVSRAHTDRAVLWNRMCGLYSVDNELVNTDRVHTSGAAALATSPHIADAHLPSSVSSSSGGSMITAIVPAASSPQRDTSYTSASPRFGSASSLGRSGPAASPAHDQPRAADSPKLRSPQKKHRPSPAHERVESARPPVASPSRRVPAAGDNAEVDVFDNDDDFYGGTVFAFEEDDDILGGHGASAGSTSGGELYIGRQPDADATLYSDDDDDDDDDNNNGGALGRNARFDAGVRATSLSPAAADSLLGTSVPISIPGVNASRWHHAPGGEPEVIGSVPGEATSLAALGTADVPIAGSLHDAYLEAFASGALDTASSLNPGRPPVSVARSLI
ncbi:uncharacterized protein AMSG_09315, partial [Thecamonas trahens ATCC 50062]